MAAALDHDRTIEAELSGEALGSIAEVRHVALAGNDEGRERESGGP
jgi:hypothetical protein